MGKPDAWLSVKWPSRVILTHHIGWLMAGSVGERSRDKAGEGMSMGVGAWVAMARTCEQGTVRGVPQQCTLTSLRDRPGG